MQEYLIKFEGREIRVTLTLNDKINAIFYASSIRMRTLRVYNLILHARVIQYYARKFTHSFISNK